jgi:flavorubredoxin
MNKTISKGVFYIGADDTNLDLFEGQYDLPAGISYNSYVITDDKVAILDTIDDRKSEEWWNNLAEVLGERKPDYLIVSHMEPDHSANVRRVVEEYPEIVIVLTAQALKLYNRFFGDDQDLTNRVKLVKDGDTLELGNRTLQFVTAPMVHWPEVMMSFEQSEGLLFSADAFGKFGALSYDDPEGWACEARRYYFNIVGKYGVQVQAVLKKLGGKQITKILPLHGPILEENLEYYINIYNTWSSYSPEDEGIFIAYCSLHGNTEKAALQLAEILKGMADVKVSVADLRRDDMAEAVEDAFRYDRMVLAAPTYDGGIMPIMADFLHHLSIKNFQNRKVAIIENGSWAPMAAKIMHTQLEAMKNITIVEPVVTVESTVKPATIEALKELAKNLI